MKIAISATGKGLDSNIDVKFERCNFFLIIHLGKNSLMPIENKTKNRPQEIGNAIGKLIAKEEINSVIAADIGPSAFDIFKQHGIRIYQAKGIVEDAIKLYKNGKLTELTKPTVPRYLDWKKKNKK